MCIICPIHSEFWQSIDKHLKGQDCLFLHKRYGLSLTITETEMIEELGYCKIWNCGLFKFIWKREE